MSQPYAVKVTGKILSSNISTDLLITNFKQFNIEAINLHYFYIKEEADAERKRGEEAAAAAAAQEAEGAPVDAATDE